ncbi:MAG TPA: twin-arginine translocase subunit TatC [Actinobacteria bacterium]|nr:twin-arginine translocase subunit TatC [Actinomycetota bacterium]
MPFLEHLRELRARLVKSAAAVAVGTVVSFVFFEDILAFLAAPYHAAVPEGSLVFFTPTGGFSVAMSVSLWGGLVLASPVILYQTWRFVSPALTEKERRWAVPLTGVFVSLFLVGIVAGYYALYRGIGFLIEFAGAQLTPVIGANDYLRFTMRFLLAFGLAFEFPVFLFAAAAFGIVTSRQLAEFRRWAIVVILVIAAAITPTGDPLTLSLLSIPMYLLYEAAIVAIRLVLRR